MSRKPLAYAVIASSLMIVPASPGQAQLFEGTTGDCISDFIYGNEPNMADGSLGGPEEQEPGTQAGNVLPTQSPGPFVNNPSDPDNPTRGSSVGDFHRQFGGGAVPEFCRTVTDL